MFGKYLKWIGYILIIIGFFAIYLVVPQESLGQALRVITIPQGGTGTSTLPNTGEVLVGNGSGGYKFVNTSTFGGGGGGGGGFPTYFQNSGATLNTATTTVDFTSNSFAVVENPTDTLTIRVSTTTLGLLTTNVSEGSNLYYTDARVSSYLWGSSTVVLASTTRATNWDTAFSWGNHASQGYITDGNTNWDNIYGLLTTVDISANTNLSADGTEIVLTGDALSLGNNLSFTYGSTTGFTATNLYAGSLTGLLKGTSGLIGTASNGTDYTLISGTTCVGTDKVSAVSASGVVTCSTDQTGGGGGVSDWKKNTALDAITPTTTVGIVVNASSSISTLNTGIASTTNFFGADLASCTGASNKLTWSGGKFLCEADQTGGGGSKWTDGGLFTYLTDTADDVVLGSNDTATAPFWFDVSANNLLIGNSSSADSQITFGPSSAPFSLGYNNGVFRVSTSTTLGGTDLFTLFSTSTGAIATTTQGMFTFNDLRATVGDKQYLSGLTLLPLDTLNVYGPIDNGTWVHRECNVMQSSLAAAAISADTANVCGDFMFQEDTTGTNAMLTTGSYGGYYNQIAVANALPNDGAGLFLWGGLSFGSSTPVFKSVARIMSPANATSSQEFLGFTTMAPSATVFQDFPSGCMFVASSTQANWVAYCGDVSTTNKTFVDTGVPSTTSQTANANQFYRFSIYADAKNVKFYIATPSASQKLVATIENTLPVANLYNPAVYLGTQLGGGGSRGIDVKYISVDYNLGI